MEQAILAELKKLLRDEHDKVVGELQSIAKRDPNMKGDWDARFPQFDVPQTGEYGSHGKMEEEADEVEEFEVLLAAEHSLESRLLEINRALERMEKGGYGICGKCKKEIPLDRLRANPAAEFDIEHAS